MPDARSSAELSGRLPQRALKYYSEVRWGGEPGGIGNAFYRKVGIAQHELSTANAAGGQFFQHGSPDGFAETAFKRSGIYAELPGDNFHR